MSKIVLDEVTNSNNISKINENFAKLEIALNDKVLYRNSPIGEPNSLVTDVDVNGVKLYNLPAPTLPSQAARLQDILDASFTGGGGGGGDIPTAEQIPFTPTATVTANRVQTAIVELDAKKVALTTLAEGTGASLMGFTPTGIGATPTTVQAALDKLNQKPTGQHFTQNNARVNRVNDRLLVGSATKSDGAYPNVEKDWLTVFQQGAGLGEGSTTASTMSVLNNGASDLMAFIGGSQSLDALSIYNTAIGVSAFAVNNHPTLATSAWAFYAEAHNVVAQGNTIYGMEIDTRTLFPSVPPTPYAQGNIIGLQVASGCGLPGALQHDASAAIQIVGNPKKWQCGINFYHDSIVGTDGTTGSGVAIAFAKGHAMVWYNNAAAQTSQIQCSVQTTGRGTCMMIDDGGLNFTSSNGTSSLLQIPYVANPVNYPAVYAGGVGTPIGMAALGTDANITLNISPKGNGTLVLGGAANLLKFGVYSASPLGVTGYINIIDAGGVPRRLLVG